MSFLDFIKVDTPKPEATPVATKEGTGRKFLLDTFGQVCPFPH